MVHWCQAYTSLDNFISVILSQLVRQEELMAKLRDEITSLQDDVSKSTDQVLQEKRRRFLLSKSVI